MSNREFQASHSHQIFVVGNSRSGTTMMGRILGRHSMVFTFHELHFFEYLWNPDDVPPVLSIDQASLLAARLLTIQRDGYFTQADPQQYLEEAQAVIEGSRESLTPPAVFGLFLDYETRRYGKSISCDQTPRNLFYLREVLDLYPNAYVVNMIRDPRGVLLSQKNRWRRGKLGARNIPSSEIVRAWVNYHPITMSMLWNSAIRAGEALGNDSRVFHLRFESLLNAPAKSVHELCAFLGLEFQSEMLQIPRVGSSHRLDQPDQMGIDPSVAGRWQEGGLNAAEIYACQQIAGAKMARYEYEISNVRLPVLGLGYYGLTWPLKSALALLLNLSKNRSVLGAIKRRLLDRETA